SQVELKTTSLKISLGQKGDLTGLTDMKAPQNYFFKEEPAYLLSIKIDDSIRHPQSLNWQKKTSLINLSYPGNIDAQIRVLQNNSYISFELVKITKADKIQLAFWGPYPTTIGDTVGEVVGVVRNKDFAIGIQSLNIKTLGGYPSAESDIQPSYDVFSGGNKVDVLKEDLNKQMYRGDVARNMPYGSSLQAYCRNRNKDRVIENWSHSHYVS